MIGLGLLVELLEALIEAPVEWLKEGVKVGVKGVLEEGLVGNVWELVVVDEDVWELVVVDDVEEV
jgi:hypothetical protein